MTAQDYIQSLNLQPHPEGGYFAETYRSAETIPRGTLPDRFSGARAFGTAIYFLLERHHVSALHRIQADEIWHFYAGGPLEVFVINPDATLSVIRLGSNPGRGEVFQAVVPAGCWFGSKPAVDAAAVDAAAVDAAAVDAAAVDAAAVDAAAVDSTAEQTNFSLVGCTVAPGFDFADFEMGERDALLIEFPQHRAMIEMLTT